MDRQDDGWKDGKSVACATLQRFLRGARKGDNEALGTEAEAMAKTAAAATAMKTKKASRS